MRELISFWALTVILTASSTVHAAGREATLRSTLGRMSESAAAALRLAETLQGRKPSGAAPGAAELKRFASGSLALLKGPQGRLALIEGPSAWTADLDHGLSSWVVSESGKAIEARVRLREEAEIDSAAYVEHFVNGSQGSFAALRVTLEDLMLAEQLRPKSGAKPLLKRFDQDLDSLLVGLRGFADEINELKARADALEAEANARAAPPSGR